MYKKGRSKGTDHFSHILISNPDIYVTMIF